MDKNVTKGDRLARIAGVWNKDVALSLMRAAPFRITDRTILHFEPHAQAADVLCSSSGQIPNVLVDWNYRLKGEDVRARQKAMRRLTWDGAEYKLTYQWRTDQGEEIWLEEQGRRKSGLGDIPTEIEGVIRNVTSRRRVENRTAFLATHDDLTSVSNAAATEKSLDHLAALTNRQRGEGALLRLRLTNLSDINAVYGFETGDRLLIEFARRLSHIVRAPDVLGRIGGADFGLVLYGSTAEDVRAIAKRLFFLLENSPVQTPHGGLYGEFAASSTQMRTQAESATEALYQTEVAIEDARPSELKSYKETMASDTIRTRQETTADDILNALNQRRVQLAYQPIIETKTSRLHHYEALLRLRREDGEVVSAGRFIMAAERLGLVHLLDRRALELAAETLATEPDVHLALNVSAGTVKDVTAASEYIAALKALGPAAERVTLELTETVALDDPAMASEFSNEVRAIGCEFAIDDFGSGYTTFRNLMAIEADMIKIDGTLIEGIASDPNKQTFVRMMVDLAQTFSVKTVAEMVDDRADADILRRLGVDYLQGFMFGIPSAAPSWQKRAS
jgi:diguanylate cyclase (GGDEF)-like protein